MAIRQPKIAWMMLLAVGVAGGHAGNKTVSAKNMTSSVSVVEVIRRQLMQNNYDYMPSSRSTEELFARRRGLRRSNVESALNGTSLLEALPEHTAAIGGHPLDLPDPVNNILADTDRWYPGSISIEDRGGAGGANDEGITTASAKYKLLTMRPHGNSRRSSPRRFIQEESAAGVVIMRLDNAPFPQFRLPNFNRLNNNFVNLLQENLRKNNDDYVEANLVVSNPYLATTSAPPEHTGRGGRRAYHVKPQLSEGYDWKNNFGNNAKDPKPRWSDFGLPDVDTKSDKTPNELPSALGNVHKFMAGGKKNDVRVIGAMPAEEFTTSPKKYIKAKKDFLDRNMALLKGFFSNNRLKEDTNLSAEATSTDLSGLTQEDKDTAAMKTALRQGPVLGREQRPVLREQSEKPTHVPADPVEVIDPNALDMAPAKGAKVHVLRAKGRLCYRSVLLPEGPKYDAKGKAYLAAHAPAAARRRAFAATRAPALRLPRCCNCCRKSVLGCD